MEYRKLIKALPHQRAWRRPIPMARTGEGTMDKTPPHFHEDFLAQLQDSAGVAEYLDAALEESAIPEVFLHALRTVAEAKGMAHLARETDLKPERLYQMLSERGNPVLSSLYAILDALDMRLSKLLSERGNPVLSSLYAILEALGLRLTVVCKEAA
jgi:probable addiction module antidote protein